jgi:type IVB pilus formation R64 PilN family outer membrane protein
MQALGGIAVIGNVQRHGERTSARGLVPLLTAFASLAALGGCAVTSNEVGARYDAAKAEVKGFQAAVETERSTQEPPFQRLSGNYLGSTSLPVSAAIGLPMRFQHVVLTYGRAEGSFVEAARNVRGATGLAVRFSADIYTNLAAAPGGQGGTPAATAVPAAIAVSAQPIVQAQPSGGPLPPGGLLASRQVAPTSVPAAAQPAVIPAYAPVPLSFQGNLADYLNTICAAAGLSWEYQDGELYFYRLVTRTFLVELGPRTIDITDTTSGGGQATLSAGSGSGGASSTSSSTASFATKYDPLTDFAKAVRGLLSPWGQLAPNPATGSFVVTDTRSVMDRVAAFIGSENAKLQTRIDVEIRTVSLTLNDGAQIGADFSLIYNALNAAGTGSNGRVVFAPPANVATASTLANPGGLTGSILSPTNRWNGSSVSVQALNTYGKIVSDRTHTVPGRNRVPAQYQEVTDVTYLAATTPATGGGTSGGVGVPGLTPGMVSVGTFLTVTPSVSDNGTVTVSLSATGSSLVEIKTEQTGSGETAQKLTLPTITRTKTGTDFVIPKGGSAVAISSAGDQWNSSRNTGLSGASASGTHNQVITIMIVTPHVYPGV